MAEIGTASVKVVPDYSEWTSAPDNSPQDGVRLFFNVLTILLLICAPALVWAIYGWAF